MAVFSQLSVILLQFVLRFKTHKIKLIYNMRYECRSQNFAYTSATWTIESKPFTLRR